MIVQAVSKATHHLVKSFQWLDDECTWTWTSRQKAPGPLKIYLKRFHSMPVLCNIVIEQHGSHFTWSRIVRAGSTAMHHLVTIVLVAGLHVQLDREPSAYSTRTSSFWQAAVARATIGFLLSVLSWPPGVQLILLHYHTAGAQIRCAYMEMCHWQGRLVWGGSDVCPNRPCLNPDCANDKCANSQCRLKYTTE